MQPSIVNNSFELYRFRSAAEKILYDYGEYLAECVGDTLVSFERVN